MAAASSPLLLGSGGFLISRSDLMTSKLFSTSSLSFAAVRSRNVTGIRAAGNSFGTYFRVTTFGESHGVGVGCVIDGCPPRRRLSEADLQAELNRRRTGQEGRTTTNRKETDTCQILSGVTNGVTTGTPILVLIPNTEKSRHDYDEMSMVYRPSHADATYDMKYGVRAIEGGGRASARETIGRVAAGAVAKKILKELSGTEIIGFASQVHDVIIPEGVVDYNSLTQDEVERSLVRCPIPKYAEKMMAAIDAVHVAGDSIGGVVTCIVKNSPRNEGASDYTIRNETAWGIVVLQGLGSPVFDKLEAELAKALMSIPASKGFDIGSGFAGTSLTGSQHNDPFFVNKNGRIRTRTNRSGGIQGGISNGEIIEMRVAFKPIATIGIKQQTVTRDKREVELKALDCHDPCVVTRAVPIVEAMVSLVLVDQLMAQHGQCNLFPINQDLQEPIQSPALVSTLL